MKKNLSLPFISVLIFSLSSYTDVQHAMFLYLDICLLSLLKFILENT